MTQQQKRLTTRLLCERYAVCDRTISRWCSDPKLGFPKPMVIRKRRYWNAADVDAFDRAQGAA